MSVQKESIIKALSSKLPREVVESLIDDYQHIKEQFFLNKYQHSELNAARFSEAALRLVEYVDIGSYTPFGKQINSEQSINRASNNTALPEGIRYFIPRLVRVLLDIRNKRNVAHIGGEVSPNYSDSLLVSHCADWILVEIIRNYHCNSIDEARKMVDNIVETRIPIVAEIEGFRRVQDTNLDFIQKTLVVLYYKQPSKVLDKDLITWIKYSNPSRYKRQILGKLDSDALIHYDVPHCTLLPKGIMYVEKNISLDLLIS